MRLLCILVRRRRSLRFVSNQNIYNEKSRHLYDFWGLDQEEMSLYETQVNVGLFYLLWIAIMYVESDVGDV